MAESVAKLRVFIGSPSDCIAERQVIRRLIESDPSIQTLARNLDVAVDACGWEDVFPNAGRPQSLINEAVKRYDPNWVVFIFWHRFGSDSGHGMTGTEEEWNIALEHKQQRGDTLAVSIYFNNAAALPYEIDGRQLDAVKSFRTNVYKRHQALAAEFNGANHFEEIFRNHLTQKLFSTSTTHPQESANIPTYLLNASRALLSWPSTLGEGKRMESDQLGSFLHKIQESDTSSTVILGAPGSGKSAFLARLANCLAEQQIPLLAIKADQIGAMVESLEDLRVFLDLSINPSDALIEQSGKGKVVLIIDQLDAVSELLDRKSGRLNVLLNFIHSLAGRRNIHIVASSREFEFRHDVRLSNIDAERLDLASPTWDQVSQVLSQCGIESQTIGASLQNLLLNPLNLKIFLEIGASNVSFASHHALLEELWRQRVVSAGGVETRQVLLELLAERMANEETLWLPTAVTDGSPAERDSLEQADILTRGYGGLSIGFRHQTYYDFTIARSFARGDRALSNHVLSRQDGLFIRPSLIAGLNYLRAAARVEYHKQLFALMGAQLRLHVRTLIIEVLGGQDDPDDFEMELILPLLASDDEGPRTLRSVANSMGWFARLKGEQKFARWLNMPAEKAAHCVPLLSTAIRHDPQTCINLIKQFWIGNEAYDSLSLTVFREKREWERNEVDLICMIARRTQLPWFIEYLAERVADSVPMEAPRIIRADFDRQLDSSLKELAQPVPDLPESADKQNRLLHAMTYERSRPVRQIIENSRSWDNLEEFASRAPTAFLDQLWPWFVKAVTLMAHDEHEFVIGYKHDPTSYRDFEGDLLEPAPIIAALLVSIRELAAKDRNRFLELLKENMSSELLIVHRLLSRGLTALVTQDAETALEYLCSDPRRLVLGGMHDPRADTKRLITALSSHLDTTGVHRLEKTILQFSSYGRILSEWSAKERFERRRWDREKRLDLLRAIPLELLSPETKKIRSEEELVFPEDVSAVKRDACGLLSTVGARMTVNEMTLASDEDLVSLFDELPDSVGWDNPKRKWSRDMSRAGGAIQLSREFGELAKQAPDRVFALISRLQPGVHEQYAGEAVKGLTNSNMASAAIVGLIEDLDSRGFRSRDFRDDISFAAEVLAARDKGLPDRLLKRFLVWITEEPEPVWPEAPTAETEERDEERTYSILYGHSMTSTLTHARGSITRAIAEGYLRRDPPDIEGWARVIESRLSEEKHPKLWSEVLTRMLILFRGDRRYATSLLDKVIKACPKVLEFSFALNAIAHVLRGLEPKEVGESWLEMLRMNGTTLCSQAYGELLPLFNFIHQDGSSKDRLTSQLEGDRHRSIDLGLAYAATYLWTSKTYRETATRILCILSHSDNEEVQKAVASLFRMTRDSFELDSNMRMVISEVVSNGPLLLWAAEDLIGVLEPMTGTEPDLVTRVSGQVVRFGAEQINKPGTSSWMYVAGALTNIALTLHRQTAYREAGLQLFEQLIALNVREATDAIELLDRRPVVNPDYQHRPRWRRRPRRVRR